MFVTCFKVYKFSDSPVKCECCCYAIIKYISSVQFTLTKDSNLTFNIHEVC